MLYQFRLRITRAARLILPPRKQEAVLDEIGRVAEAQASGEGENAIFDLHDFNLKAVVNFHDRTVWVLTPQEYKNAGLPEAPGDSG